MLLLGCHKPSGLKRVPIVAHLLHNSSVVDYAHVRVNVAATAIFPRLDGGAYCCATFTIMSV